MTTKANTKSSKARNTAARLSAAQAVYQMVVNEQAAEDVIKEYIALRLGANLDGDMFVSADVPLFSKTVQDVETHYNDLNKTIAAIRGKADTDNSIAAPKSDILLQSILLCGLAELLFNTSTDSPIIIADYVSVAHGFFDQKEPNLINAILDKAAKTTL